MKSEILKLKEQEKEYFDRKEAQSKEFQEIAIKSGDFHTDLLIALEVSPHHSTIERG